MRSPEEYLGKPVRSLQTMLRTVAKAGAPIPYVIPDGIFGPDTEAAVRAFQAYKQLPVTGEMDLDSWQALLDANRAATEQLAPAVPLRILLQPNQEIKPGEHNKHLFLIQAMLHVLHLCYCNAPDVSINGTLDPATQRALHWLQKTCDLPEGNEFTRACWNRLCQLYAASAQDGTA